MSLNLVGNEGGSKDKIQLKEKGITHILVAAKFYPSQFPDEFVYKSIPLLDFKTENLLRYLEEAIEFIKQGEKVLVHGQAGVSRSASIVLAYLMIEKGMRFQEALEYLQKRMPVVSPNSGLQVQLKKLDELLVEDKFDINKLKEMTI